MRLIWLTMLSNFVNNFANSKVETGIIPDVVWNRPFKDRIQERYDNWLANAKHEYTAAGNMKPASRRLVVEWIIQSWEEISKELVSNFMKSCALALAIDGCEDGFISCFKEGKKCKADWVLLESQMRLFNDDEPHKDPFEVSPEIWLLKHQFLT